MRTVKLNKKMKATLEQQLEAFRRKFGREPGADDPVFFDPDEDYPTPLTEEKLAAGIGDAGRKAGIDSEKMESYIKATK